MTLVSASPAFNGFNSLWHPSKKPLNEARSKPTDAIVNGKAPTFITDTPLAEALKWTPQQTFNHLNSLISQNNQQKLARGEMIASPLAEQQINNSDWIKQTKIIDVNPRAVGSYFNILKTAMIYPERGVHILPCYETDNACLYEPQSWKLSREFLDPTLTQMGFKTPDQQLRFVISALHAMGKTVGMDVLPHTTAYSKESFVNPEHFEWFQLNRNQTAQLYPKSTRFKNLSPWEKEKVTEYFIHSNTSDAAYNLFFQDLKQKEALNAKGDVSGNLQTYMQILEATRQVYHLAPLDLEIQGWSRYKALIEKKDYQSLSANQKEVLQRVYDARVKDGVAPDDVERFFRQNMALQNAVDSPKQAVQATIIQFLRKHGDADNKPVQNVDRFFERASDERAEILLGSEETPQGAKIATDRRNDLIEALHNAHLYPAPVADHEVLRPIRFDRMHLERDPYPTFDKPGSDPACSYEFFGTLTPYSFYPVKANGYLDTHHPNPSVFQDYARHVANLQSNLGLDFIRADMAHVQTAHATDTPVANPPEYLAYTKAQVQKQAPYFAVLGESFLSGKKSINLVQDMNQKEVDAISGNLDQYPVDANFMGLIKAKSKAPNRRFQEAFSVVTHDSDDARRRPLNQDPRATQTRYFTSLFQANPGYSMAGYESRPVSFNHDYLFKQPKPFNWGSDREQFKAVQSMRQQYAKMDAGFSSPWRQSWLSTSEKGVDGWVWSAPNAKQPQWLMVSNTDLTHSKEDVLFSNPFALPPRKPLCR